METALGILIFSTLLIILSWKRITRFSKTRYSVDNNMSLKASKTMEQLPTPPSLPLIGNLLHIFKPGADHGKLLVDLAKKYGPFYKLNFLGAKFVVLNEPSMIQKVLSSSNPNYLNKHANIYSLLLTGRLANGLIVADYNKWHLHRRIMSRAFNFQSLEKQLTFLNQRSKELVSNLDEIKMKENNANINDMVHWMIVKFVLHTIMESDDFTNSDLKVFAENNDILMRIVNERTQKPWLLIGPLLFGSIWDFHPINRRVQRANDNIDKLFRKIIESYKNKIELGQSPTVKNENDNDDFEGKRYKCLMEELLESGFSDNDVLDEAMTIITAGHETTSGSLMFLLFQLALNIEIQEKCREEVDILFDSKQTSNENVILNDNDLTMDDLTKLKYLERCVMENLRICPVIPIFMRRLEASLDINEKMELPVGTTAVINPWTLHRNTDVFPDPEKFDPDRFLPENCQKRHVYSYLPFSSGPRNCIGWKTALMTMKVMTAFILRNYKIETKDKWEDVDFIFQLSLSTKNKINLNLVKREVLND